METRSSTNDLDQISEVKNCKIAEESSSACSSSQPDENLQWVQCENPDCLKWRLLSNDDVKSLDVEAPWFCYMNNDVLLSSCDDHEEKYSSTSKMRRHGLSYKYSLLPEGSIVWAKLPGYCKWPAILCSSPASSEYCIFDNDGDPYSYHVEFLGTKHSIAWVHHEKITAYGNLGKEEALETCSQPLSQVSMNRFRIKAKKRKRSWAQKKRISIQLAEQLQKAIDEADDLIEMEKDEILNSCQYRYKPHQKITTEQETGKKKRKKHKRNPETLSSSQMSNHAIDNKLSDFQSKEERLMADIKGLKEREMEFMDDYTKFMKNKGKKVKNPRWFGVTVKLFQLYMAVQDRGGFNEVCSSSLWKSIVTECCDVTTNKMSSSAASTALTFYSRRLLPYETHIKALLPEEATKNENISAEMLATTIERSDVFPAQPTDMGEDEALKELEEIEALLENVEDGDVAATADDDTEPVLSACDTSQKSNLRSSQKSANSETQPSSPDLPSAADKDSIKSNSQCGNAFRDLSPSQLFPEADEDNVVSEPEDAVDSDEDLFAEISRDEELLQSFLSTS